MNGFIRPTAASLVALTLAACATRERAVGVTGHHQVELRNLVMVPGVVEMVAGDTVTWTNRDIVPHTVTASGGTWDSGTISAAGQWTLVALPSDSGEYLCRFHPGMVGRLVVH